MKHLKRFNEAVTTELTFHKYYDKMSKDDEIKSNNLLEKDPSRWTAEEKKFMDKMSMKNRQLFIGSDKNIYTEEDIIQMGLDPNKIAKKEKKDRDPQFANQVRSLISSYETAIKDSTKTIEHNEYEADLVKIVRRNINNLENTIAELKKFITIN